MTEAISTVWQKSIDGWVSGKLREHEDTLLGTVSSAQEASRSPERTDAPTGAAALIPLPSAPLPRGIGGMMISPNDKITAGAKPQKEGRFGGVGGVWGADAPAAVDRRAQVIMDMDD